MIRKTWHLFIVAIVFLTAQNCKKQEGKTIDLKEFQGQRWLHSYEEDSADFKAYRPDTFNFPPSRGRAGFMIENDSTFILYSIAPTDGWEKHYGKIKVSEGNHVEITFNQKSRPSITYEVITKRKDFLLIKEVRKE